MYSRLMIWYLFRKGFCTARVEVLLRWWSSL